MCFLDEITTGGVGKGATMRVFAKTIPIGEYEFWGLKKKRKGLWILRSLRDIQAVVSNRQLAKKV